MLNPFLKKKKKQQLVDGVYYASLTRRLIALSLDLVLMMLIWLPFDIMFSFLDPNNIMGLVVEYIKQMQDKSSFDFEGFLIFLKDRGILVYYIVVNYMLPLVVNSCYLLFLWIKYNSTFGLMLLKCKFIDVNTMGVPTKKQYIVRLLLIIFVPFGTVGQLIIPFNKRRRGLYEFIPGMAVVVNTTKSRNDNDITVKSADQLV